MAEKITIRQFAAKLDEYSSGGAARKAVGRFSGWSEDEKTKAHRMIDQRFGAVVKKGASLSAQKSKTQEPPKRRGRPPNPISVVTPALPKRRGRPPKPVAVSPPVAPSAPVAEPPSPLPPQLFLRQDPTTFAQVMAERYIQTLSAAIINAETLKRIQPDIGLNMQAMANLHNTTLDILAKVLSNSIEKTEVAATPTTGARRGRPPNKPELSFGARGGNGKGSLESEPLFTVLEDEDRDDCGEDLA